MWTILFHHLCTFTLDKPSICGEGSHVPHFSFHANFNVLARYFCSLESSKGRVKQKRTQRNRSVAAEISRSTKRSSVTSGAETQKVVSSWWERTKKWWRGAREKDSTEGGKGNVLKEANPESSLLCSVHLRDQSSPAAALSKQEAPPFKTGTLVLC